MSRLIEIVIAGFLFASAERTAYGDEQKQLLTESTWFHHEDPRLHPIAYDWEYLMEAHRIAKELTLDLKPKDPAQIEQADYDRLKKARMIAGALDEAVLGACDRTLPLLRDYPDKVLTQNLLIHSIRHNGGANERWPAIIITLCLMNEEWTEEVFTILDSKERDRLKSAIRYPSSSPPSENETRILKILAKATKS